MLEPFRITDLKKVWVSYGPFSLITFNSIDLEFYRDEQNKLSAKFKYDIHFGDYDEKSEKQLFIGIDIREVPEALRDSEISFEYQTASFISDVKDKSFHIVNDTTSRVSLPTHNMNIVYWSFNCDLKELSNVRATSEPLSIIDVPIYLHSAKTQGHGIVSHINNIDMRKPCFVLRVDLTKNRNMISYAPDNDMTISFDKLDEDEKEIALNLVMKDLPKFIMPQYAKEVNREIMIEYSKDLEDKSLQIQKQIKSCLLAWTPTGNDKFGESTLTIHDTLKADQGGYTYTPMHNKWFLNY